MDEVKQLRLMGHFVELELLSEEHREELRLVANDQQIWSHMPIKALDNQFDLWFDKAIQGLSSKKQLPLIVRSVRDHAMIGSTRYYDINDEHHRLTIGHTWYAPAFWGSAVNPECKYLLLKHAFENLQLNRVEFFTDSRNTRSRGALTKLGAKEEGILRHHMILNDGYIRDTVAFSIIQPEWPILKNKLEKRIADFCDDNN